MSHSITKTFVSEFLGTYALVFFGAGSIVVNDVSLGAVTHLGICLIFGFIVTVVVYALGGLSGAHINPAVTLGFYAAGLFDRDAIWHYILAQCLGAISAAFSLKLLFIGHATYGATLPTGSMSQSFVLEVIMTYFLMLIILFISQDEATKSFTGLAVGLMVALEATFGGPISGCSMNPARSLGPALASGVWDAFWIYILAPVLGAVLASLTWRLLKQ